MEAGGRTRSCQRVMLLAVLVLSALGLWRSTVDVFNTVKATIVVLGAAAIALVWVTESCRTRRFEYPVTRVWWAAGLLMAGLVVATLVSPTPWRSVVGVPGRHTGLVPYLSYLLLFVTTVRLYAGASSALIAKTILAVGVPATVYGLLQAQGLDPLSWRVVEAGPPVFSTFGNANFFSAYLGMVVPLACWGALSHHWGARWRMLSGLAGVLAFAGALASRSAQGPGVALLGASFVTAVWLSGRVRTPAHRRLAVAGGMVTGLALLACAAWAPPLAGVRAELASSLLARIPKWQVALAMFRDRPVLGFGLDTYGDWFFRYRSPAVAVASGLERSVDNPHNVFLHMLTGGGVLLAAGWVAFVCVTAYALVRGLRRLDGEERLLLGGLGGAWVAYQAQSLVSIDVPPLAVLHFVLAGAIVTLGLQPRLAERAFPALAPAAAAGLALTATGLLWGLTAPVRADRLARSAIVAAVGGAEGRASALYARATATAFWEPRYPAMAGAWLAEAHRPDDALGFQLEAVQRNPRGLVPTLNVARLYAARGDGLEAGEWYDRALGIDPSTPLVLVEVGRFRLSQGDTAGGIAVLERVLAIDPGNTSAADALAGLR